MSKLEPGERFTRLTVVQFSHRDQRGRHWWECLCDCGEARVLHSGNLRSGNTKSCGCYARDLRAARRVSLHHSEVTAVILGYRRHARDRGYAWDLTREQVVEIITQDCHYCGAPPSNVKTTKNTIEPLVYSGIDRKDNGVGYVPLNVVPCCRICNTAKRDLSLGDFLAWAKRLAAMTTQWGDVADREVAA